MAHIFGNSLANSGEINSVAIVADDHDIIFRTNGQDRISINVTGQMLFGDTLFTSSDQLVIYDEQQPFIRFQNNNSDKDTRIGFDTDNNFQIDSLGDTEIKFLTNNINRLIITDDGNINIGTTTVPETARLWIDSTSNAVDFPDLRIESSDDNDVFIHFKIPSTEFAIGIDDSNSDAFTISESSRVGGGNNRFTLKGSKLGLNESSPLATLHVNQSSSSGSVHVLELEQNDDDKHFIEFTGASAANTTNCISSLTTAGSTQGFIKCEVNGATKWIQFYDAPS
jgi:hypothetical protein